MLIQNETLSPERHLLRPLMPNNKCCCLTGFWGPKKGTFGGKYQQLFIIIVQSIKSKIHDIRVHLTEVLQSVVTWGWQMSQMTVVSATVWWSFACQIGLVYSAPSKGWLELNMALISVDHYMLSINSNFNTIPTKFCLPCHLWPKSSEGLWSWWSPSCCS